MRFTARGSVHLESFISDLLKLLVARLEGLLQCHAVRGLYLVGGYGRGEGGLRHCKGSELPQNNFDLLLVRRGPENPELAERVRQVEKETGYTFDLSQIHEQRLRRASTTLLWYEARHGHWTLWGDAGFWQSTDHSLQRVRPSEFCSLLTNRAVLLLINDQLALHGPVRDRHVAKAVLGYGDAWLASCGQYHWSYLEKRRRLEVHAELDPAFKRLYQHASEFRLAGGELVPPDRDLLAALHLDFLRRRYGVNSWSDFDRRAPFWDEDGHWPRAWAGRLRQLWQQFRAGRWRHRPGWLLAGPRLQLNAVAPYFLYDQPLPRVLSDWSGDFLRTWSQACDFNFGKLVEAR